MVFSCPKVRGKQLLASVHGLLSRQVPLWFSPSVSYSPIEAATTPTISSHSMQKKGGPSVAPHQDFCLCLIGHEGVTCPHCAEGGPGTGVVVRVCGATLLPYPFAGFSLPVVAVMFIQLDRWCSSHSGILIHFSSYQSTVFS